MAKKLAEQSYRELDAAYEAALSSSGLETVGHLAKLTRLDREFISANAHLIAAAPDLLAALTNVQKLISEAAVTGFNYKDGDWPERLFFSQQKTSAALSKARGEGGK